MGCELLKSYKRIGIGSYIKIKDNCFNNSFGLSSVISAFLTYIKTHGNQFTVREITKIDDEVLFEVWEIHGILYYDQIEPISKLRVINCYKKKS